MIIKSQSNPHLEEIDSSYKMRRVLQKYRQKENQKSTLVRKLNIIVKNCEKNNKKVKVIENQMMKIKSAKIDYYSTRMYILPNIFREIDQMLDLQRQERQRKVKEVKAKKQIQRMHLKNIKDFFQNEKHKHYSNFKERQKKFEETIYSNWKSCLNTKRQRSQQIRMKQQQGKMSRIKYLQKKRLAAKQLDPMQLQNLQKQIILNEIDMYQLKKLQESITNKLNESRNNLNKSRTSFMRQYR